MLDNLVLWDKRNNLLLVSSVEISPRWKAVPSLGLHPGHAMPSPPPSPSQATAGLPRGCWGPSGCHSSVFMVVPQGLQSEVAESCSQRRLLPPRSELQQHFSWRQNSSLKRKCRDSSFKCSTGLSRSFFAAIHKALGAEGGRREPCYITAVPSWSCTSSRRGQGVLWLQAGHGNQLLLQFSLLCLYFLYCFLTFFLCSPSLRAKGDTSLPGIPVAMG